MIEARLLAVVWALGLTGAGAGATLAAADPAGLLVVVLSVLLMVSGRSGLAGLDVTPSASGVSSEEHRAGPVAPGAVDVTPASRR